MSAFRRYLLGKSPRSSADTDQVVGAQVRLQRERLDLSQAAVARILGISPSQLQKYEAGKDRISASKLYALSKLLGVEISYFFNEGAFEPPKAIPAEVSHELSSAFSRIQSRRLRRALLDLIDSISG